MKALVAVSLIIMGALRIVTPAISDYFLQRNLINLMTRHEFAAVKLDGKMGGLYGLGCWLAGSVMVGVAVPCSFLDGKLRTCEA